MIKPKGGRGKKAPYNTVVIRVPVQIAEEVRASIDEFRNLYISNSDQSQVDKKAETIKLSLHLKEKLIGIEEAKKILKQKQSAKKSIVKLLQVLYDDNTISLEDLEE